MSDEEGGTVLKIEYQRDIEAAAAAAAAAASARPARFDNNDDDESSESDTQPFPVPQQPIIDSTGKKGN